MIGSNGYKSEGKRLLSLFSTSVPIHSPCPTFFFPLSVFPFPFLPPSLPPSLPPFLPPSPLPPLPPSLSLSALFVASIYPPTKSNTHSQFTATK